VLGAVDPNPHSATLQDNMLSNKRCALLLPCAVAHSLGRRTSSLRRAGVEAVVDSNLPTICIHVARDTCIYHEELPCKWILSAPIGLCNVAVSVASAMPQLLGQGEPTTHARVLPCPTRTPCGQCYCRGITMHGSMLSERTEQHYGGGDGEGGHRGAGQRQHAAVRRVAVALAAGARRRGRRQGNHRGGRVGRCASRGKRRSVETSHTTLAWPTVTRRFTEIQTLTLNETCLRSAAGYSPLVQVEILGCVTPMDDERSPETQLPAKQQLCRHGRDAACYSKVVSPVLQRRRSES